MWCTHGAQVPYANQWKSTFLVRIVIIFEQLIIFQKKGFSLEISKVTFLLITIPKSLVVFKFQIFSHLHTKC